MLELWVPCNLPELPTDGGVVSGWLSAGVAPLAGCSTRESTNNRLPAGGRGLRTTSIRAEPRADGKRVATAAQQRAAEAIATA